MIGQHLHAALSHNRFCHRRSLMPELGTPGFMRWGGRQWTSLPRLIFRSVNWNLIDCFIDENFLIGKFMLKHGLGYAITSRTGI
jgi:hypothetical protein